MAKYQIIERNEGEETIIASGLTNFLEVRASLAENSYIFDWLFEDEKPSFDFPDFEGCETFAEIGEVLEEISLSMSWWGVVVVREAEGAQEELNPRDTKDWE